MEMGSSSLGVTGGSRSNESLHGLKFGKKIYFEDVGSGGVAAAKAPAPAPAPAKKGRGAGQGGQQPPPRCQVEGCKVDLTGAKAYYCRHKVCAMHSKSPKVVVNGMEQRFCQQCSRFHQLHEFDQGKRSCRRRLAGHNERRRKPPPGPLSSRYGHLSSPFHDGGRFGGFLMDFTYPRQPSGARGMWPTVRANDHPVANPWRGTLDGPSSSRVPTQPVNPYGRGSTGGSLFANHELQTSECLGVSDSSCALSLLSNQPWVAAAAAASSRAPMISINSHGGAQMAQSTAATSFVSNPWIFKGHGTNGGLHEIPPEMSLGLAAEPSKGRFSGELELALQGSREHSSSNNLVHWSL